MPDRGRGLSGCRWVVSLAKWRGKEYGCGGEIPRLPWQSWRPQALGSRAAYSCILIDNLQMRCYYISELQRHPLVGIKRIVSLRSRRCSANDIPNNNNNVYHGSVQSLFNCLSICCVADDYSQPSQRAALSGAVVDEKNRRRGREPFSFSLSLVHSHRAGRVRCLRKHRVSSASGGLLPLGFCPLFARHP